MTGISVLVIKASGAAMLKAAADPDYALFP